ncbi:MAG: glycosyltransferase family 2 protein [Candidatus Omnitrophica bacterium]|nr:glycosyltransferase family 2 protein [Candidatus Omnitrophota bacterium]
MLDGKKIVVVMPAYNAESTLEKTYIEIPKDIVDEILLVDDKSHDKTVHKAKELGIATYLHDENMGYGANQKTCYKLAIERGADIVVMLHPDYQYPARLIPAMAGLLVSGVFDIALGSRILGGMALKGGMPLYKYVANRALTLFENVVMGQKISEYHTGYRAFKREVLLNLPIIENSDDFVFDNEMLAQSIYFGYSIGEVTSPTNYNKEASSISFARSIVYGFGILWTCLRFILQRCGLAKFGIFDRNGRKIMDFNADFLDRLNRKKEHAIL